MVDLLRVGNRSNFYSSMDKKLNPWHSLFADSAAQKTAEVTKIDS
jgi:hypothetical protein